MRTADQLSRLLGPLRRAVLRNTRDAAKLPDLPEAQIELLRVLASGTASVRETADRLRMAPATVSNLVRSMTAQGLVERRHSTVDLRVVELAATSAALRDLRRYDQASRRVLERAIGQLDEADQQLLRDAVPVLSALLEILDQAKS